jgi:aspartate dehydrogenase
VSAALDNGAVPGIRVTAISSRHLSKAKEFAQTLASPPVVVDIHKLPTFCELVIEAASADAVDAIVTSSLAANTPVMVLSCGALLGRQDLVDMALQHHTSIHIPSGAIIGLDGLMAAAAGQVDSVTMITTKPPEGLRGAPGVKLSGVDLDHLTSPVVLYEGPVFDGFKLFPANINVSAAISMAGIGPHRTHIKVVADPLATRNIHEVVVKGDFGQMQLRIENIPSLENPRTGRLTALSVLAYLKQLLSPVHLGV